MGCDRAWGFTEAAVSTACLLGEAPAGTIALAATTGGTVTQRTPSTTTIATLPTRRLKSCQLLPVPPKRLGGTVVALRDRQWRSASRQVLGSGRWVTG